MQLNPDENETALLRPGQNAALPETVNEIFDIRALRQAGSYEKLLRELSLAFARMEAKNYRPRQRTQLCELAWKLLFEGKTPPEESLAAWADALTAAWSLPQPDARSREIFLAIYENLSDPDFSLQTIAQQRLFMSEDHLRRIFSQMTGERFSAYLERARITQAQRLTVCRKCAAAFLHKERASNLTIQRSFIGAPPGTRTLGPLIKRASRRFVSIYGSFESSLFLIKAM